MKAPRLAIAALALWPALNALPAHPADRAEGAGIERAAEPAPPAPAAGDAGSAASPAGQPRRIAEPMPVREVATRGGRAPGQGPSGTALLITLTLNTGMVFGKVVAGATPGTVVLTPAGARSATGGAKLGNAAGAGATNFLVGGPPLTGYSIVLPASATLTSGSNTMTVNAFTSTPGGSGTLSVLGSQALTVGATLQVGASQAAGAYSGTFNVTVTIP